MLTGHAAVAFAGYHRQPSASVVLLLAGSYLPDIVSFALQLVGASGYVADQYSHSVPAIIAQAALLALVAVVDRVPVPAASTTAVVVLSHWPLDLLTGQGKPLWAFGPSWGLGLYRHDLLDFAIEGALLLATLVCWQRRGGSASMVSPTDRRLVVRALAVATVGQGLFNLQSGYRPVRRMWRRVYRETVSGQKQRPRSARRSAP